MRAFASMAIAIASIGTAPLAFAQGTDGPGRARVGDEYLELRVDRDCADSEHAAILGNQLRMRLPETMVVRGELGTTGQSYVDWRPAEGGCELVFRNGETTSAMTLEANADLEQIELAASRVAFLASLAGTSGSSSEPGLGVPGSELDELALAAAVAARATRNNATDRAQEIGELPTPPPVDELEETTPEDAPAEDAADEAATADEPDPAEPESDVGTRTEPAERPRRNYSTPEFELSLLPGVSVPTAPPQGSAPDMALGLIGTRTQGVSGFAVSHVFNIQSDFVDGFQLATVFNIAGSVDGMQIAGIFNKANDLSGMQVAGVFNHSEAGRLGMQAAGIVNIHAGNLEGLQVAGIVNVADEMGGIQFAPVTNVAARVSGAQVGLVNVAGEVDGTQPGIVNIAEKSDTSIGLVNVVFDQPFWLLAETGSDGFTFAGLKHGSEYLKWSLWAGTSLVAAEPVLLAGIGLGLHFELGNFYLDADAIALDVSGSTAPFTTAGVFDTRLTLGWSMFDRFAVSGGVGWRYLNGSDARYQIVPGFAITPPDGVGGTPSWPHAFLGVRF
jgi:hypothetical protein